MAAKASVVFGFVYQKRTVTASAPRLASHARSQGRSSTRFIERARTTKKIAIVSDDAICAVVLQRHSSSSMGDRGNCTGCRLSVVSCRGGADNPITDNRQLLALLRLPPPRLHQHERQHPRVGLGDDAVDGVDERVELLFLDW